MEILSAVDHPDVFSLDMAWVRGMETGSRRTWWDIHFSGLGVLVYPSFLRSHCAGCLPRNLALVAGTKAEKERSLKGYLNRAPIFAALAEQTCRRYVR